MRLLRWLVRRELRRQAVEADGHLVFIDDQGKVWDLGACHSADFGSLLWATQVAYRLTRERGERARLAAIRMRIARLAEAAGRVAGEDR